MTRDFETGYSDSSPLEPCELCGDHVDDRAWDGAQEKFVGSCCRLPDGRVARREVAAERRGADAEEQTA